MDAYHIIGALLIFIGFFCLCAGLYFTFLICRATPAAKMLWGLLFALIILFIIGYLIFMWNVTSIPPSFALTSIYIIYFGGGVFVALVTFTSHKTLHLTQKLSHLLFENHALTYLASHDHLTQLLNRRGFEKAFTNIINQLSRGGPECSLIFIDLDGFKRVNDTCGHLAGDFILKAVASIFQKRIRNTDLLARYGGDEFVMLLYNTTLEQARVFADAILDSVSHTEYVYEGHTIKISCSFGIAAVKKNTKNIDELIKTADIAVYQAKAQGPGNIILSDSI